MSKGIKLFRIFGIQISVDYTWFIVFGLVAWSLSYGYFPYHYKGLERSTYLLMGLVSALLLFACVLIHEISHSYTSNKLGLVVKDITLFIFGGVAQLTKEPDDAIEELKIAIAGPVSSGVLAAVFWLISKLPVLEGHPILFAVASYLAMINTMLLVFNMIPGFPLDGGRVLRALWWMKTGDVDSATKLASRIGKGFAVFLILAGFLQIAVGNFTGGIWSVLIGVFLQQAAQSGYQQLVLKNALNGVLVRELMSTGVITVDELIPIEDVVEHYFFKYHYASFPVTSGTRPVGIITLNQIRLLDKAKWASTAVKDVMHRLTPQDVLSPDDSALEATTKMAGNSIGRFPVIAAGMVVGMVSRSDIIKLLELKSVLRK